MMHPAHGGMVGYIHTIRTQQEVVVLIYTQIFPLKNYMSSTSEKYTMT